MIDINQKNKNKIKTKNKKQDLTIFNQGSI